MELDGDTLNDLVHERGTFGVIQPFRSQASNYKSDDHILPSRLALREHKMTRPYLALSIPELLIWILEYLSGLMVAALVCKAWSAPAMDTRWRTQTIMLSSLLAKLAPIGKAKYGRAVLSPKTSITQDVWSHFLEQYANRVTKLVLNVEFETDSLALISNLLKTFGGLFCKNLTSLNWPADVGYDTENHRKLLDLLPATKLQAVRVTIKDSFFTTSTSFSQLAHRATQIREIVAPNRAYSFNFSVFSQLRSLSYSGTLFISDYHSLACCPHLRVLRLGKTWVQVTSRQWDNGAATVFPRLEEFRIHPDNDAADDMILRSVMPALRSLEYRRREMGPHSIPLLNSVIRTSHHLESIALTAQVQLSQLELIQHNGVRNLFFRNQYEARSKLVDARDHLSTIARTFPKLEKLDVV
ncbi:hypothetical protein FRB94_003815 [Tulasnella sp. JGI-2019a]|nr:hypothetical protein FRB94_003815 [Tulasnella sp. JGI-2019a]